MPAGQMTPYAQPFLSCTTLNATHTIFTSPQPGFVMMVQVTLDGVTGFTSVPTISVGTGAGADWDDIIPDTALTGLSTADEIFTLFPSNGVSKKTLGNNEVRVKIQAAASATTYTIGVVVYFVEAPFGAGI